MRANVEPEEHDKFLDWLIYVKGIEPAEADGIALDAGEADMLPDARKY